MGPQRTYYRSLFSCGVDFLGRENTRIEKTPLNCLIAIFLIIVKTAIIVITAITAIIVGIANIVITVITAITRISQLFVAFASLPSLPKRHMP